jgi:hypothetical protein
MSTRDPDPSRRAPTPEGEYVDKDLDTAPRVPPEEGEYVDKDLVDHTDDDPEPDPSEGPGSHRRDPEHPDR